MQNMKNVLIIRYPIYPVRGGVGRHIIKFIKYLPENGWHPIVLTLATNKELTSSTKKAISNHLLTVYMSPFVNPIKSLTDTFFYPRIRPKKQNHQIYGEINKLVLNLRKWFMIPDALMWWIPFAIRAGIAIARKHNVDIIFSSAPRFSCHLIAEGISKHLKIPWVAGFTDPWLPPSPKSETCKTYFPTTFHKLLNAYLEKKTITSANKVVADSGPIKKDFIRRYPNEPSDKFSVIRIGFDPEDFKDIIPRKKRKGHKTTIVHTGTFVGNRNPITFLKALRLLIDTQPQIKNKLKVLFVGRSYLDLKSMIDNLGLDDFVEIIPQVSQKESLRYQIESDILLLIVGPVKAYQFPDKIFEYLATGKPILALATGHTEDADLLEKTGAGVVANFNDIEQIATKLKNLYERINTGNIPEPNWDIIAQYDFRQLTRRLATVFNSLTDKPTS